MRTKLNLKPGEKGRLTVGANIAVREDTVDWKCYSDCVVLDESKQRTPFDMLVVASSVGIAIVEFQVLDHSGENVIEHVFEIEVADASSDEDLFGTARVSRESFEDTVGASDGGAPVTGVTSDPSAPVNPKDDGSDENNPRPDGSYGTPQSDAAGTPTKMPPLDEIPASAVAAQGEGQVEAATSGNPEELPSYPIGTGETVVPLPVAATDDAPPPIPAADVTVVAVEDGAHDAPSVTDLGAQRLGDLPNTPTNPGDELKAEQDGAKVDDDGLMEGHKKDAEANAGLGESTEKALGLPSSENAAGIPEDQLMVDTADGVLKEIGEAPVLTPEEPKEKEDAAELKKEAEDLSEAAADLTEAEATGEREAVEPSEAPADSLNETAEPGTKEADAPPSSPFDIPEPASDKSEESSDENLDATIEHDSHDEDGKSDGDGGPSNLFGMNRPVF